MSIQWDARNKRWRWQFKRSLAGVRHRHSRLLPQGWSRAQADAFDASETARLAAVAAGIDQTDPLIETAVGLYLADKQHLKSLRSAAEHLAAIAWAYAGRPMSQLPEIAREVAARRLIPASTKRGEHEISVATARNRLALLKAACRHAWKAHGLTQNDPTARMALPTVRNERQVYIDREQMLRLARACTHPESRVAIRLAFYSGLRLGELRSAVLERGLIVLKDTKNSDIRAVPPHPKIAHLVGRLPLATSKSTIQHAFARARLRAGMPEVHFHDLRHSAASAMVNAGIDLYVVGQVLGHRDPRSTKRYAHLSAATLAAAVGTIGQKRPHTQGATVRKKAAL